MLVLVLVLEWKRWSGFRRLHVGLLGIVTESVRGVIPYQTFEHEDEHDSVAAVLFVIFCSLRPID